MATTNELIEELEGYIDELNGPDDCRLIPVGEVIDRLTAIVYGEKFPARDRIVQVRPIDGRCPKGFLCIHEVLCPGAIR